ncbi:MAG: hypothetical protein APF81_02250 [Desulfosporosinus sp. BRH_c37]|nr:MAG: hypothetical protein APF81_02250 [Desulfosporosinus sp. BRH_c37]
MKKKLAAGILTVSLLVGGATTAFAATDSTALTDIKALYQQTFGIQKQILQKEVEAGAVTQDQANTIQGMMDLRQKYQEQALDSGQIMGPGMGGMGRHGYMGTTGQPLTADQQKALNDFMAQRLKLQQDALANGTLAPGMGMGGYGRWGGYVPSTVPAPATSTN